jgi:hypothetical protein
MSRQINNNDLKNMIKSDITKLCKYKNIIDYNDLDDFKLNLEYTKTFFEYFKSIVYNDQIYDQLIDEIYNIMCERYITTLKGYIIGYDPEDKNKLLYIFDDEEKDNNFLINIITF